ncbi:acetylcholinesterase-1-like [Haemaphysalis longicornis]
MRRKRLPAVKVNVSSSRCKGLLFLVVAATLAFYFITRESYVSQAMRIDNTNTTEDCLHLNVWTPIQKHPQDPKKTVMVYFYGGSFAHGGNSYFFYDGRYISGMGDVVLVVPNYRLGVLGFLNSGTPDAPGNVGIHDQILALMWVKENIAAFGGDPDRTVLFGQSAGAISVSYLQISPLTSHLFRRAILQSCSALVPLPENSNETAVANMRHVAGAVNCTRSYPNGSFSPSDTLACLRSVDAKLLVGVKGALFYPSFYDEVLPRPPNELVKSTNFDRREMLIGNTLREGDMFFQTMFAQNKSSATSSRSQLSFAAIVRAYDFFYKRAGFLQTLLTLAHIRSLYDFTSATYEGFKDAVGDILFSCPTKYFAENFVAKNGTAYFYVLTPRPSFSVWNSTAATHTDDVSLLFGVPFMLPAQATHAERQLSQRLIRVWTTFAHTGYVSLSSILGISR